MGFAFSLGVLFGGFMTIAIFEVTWIVMRRKK